MDQRMQIAIAFMKRNLHRKLSPIEVAHSVRLSPSRLRELFKRETGTSLVRYRRELRLERAKYLLESTLMSIKEVAVNIGLSSVGQFSIDFKKAFRMTPTEYAERYRKPAVEP
jgi:two-component system response regulator YesN